VAEAVQRPTTRFAKTNEQLDLQALHRVRLVSERLRTTRSMASSCWRAS
jgi:hypothetical protein